MGRGVTVHWGHPSYQGLLLGLGEGTGAVLEGQRGAQVYKVGERWQEETAMNTPFHVVSGSQGLPRHMDGHACGSWGWGRRIPGVWQLCTSTHWTCLAGACRTGHLVVPTRAFKRLCGPISTMVGKIWLTHGRHCGPWSQRTCFFYMDP